MTILVELPADLEAEVTALAAASGLPIQDYVRQLLIDRLPVRDGAALAIRQRIAAWRDTRDLPVTPPLSDAAISRETIYGDPG